MPQSIRWSLLSILLVAFLACSDEEIGGNEEMDGSGASPGSGTVVMDTTTSSSTSAQYLDLDSDYLFDQDQLYTYELLIPEENLEFIDADPAAEEYVEGSLVFQGDTLTPVGIRYKGSIGAFVGCVSGINWADPSGRKTCTKLSMKIKINWEGREEKFYGLNKLQFHSMNQDDSQMRERLGYHLFRSMGVPAPRAVHARLVINGEYNGLFALVEQIDGRFAKQNWEDDNGNVYKEAWPLTMDGLPHTETYYRESLKTNEEEGDVSLMLAFGNELAAAENTAAVRSVIEKYMNVNEILSYCLVDRMIRHDDGPFHWYCGNGCDNHNYYWYAEPTAEKMHLIAWDMDNAFENILRDANPVTPVADDFGETRNNCAPFSYGWLGFRQWSASCDKLTGGWASYTSEYASLKEEFKNNQFSETEINLLLTNWSEQIRAATIEANELHGDAVTPNRWESAVQEISEQVAYSRVNG